MKKNKNKLGLDNIYKEKTIKIDEIKNLDNKEESKLFEDTLNAMYENKFKVNSGMVNKCRKLLLSKHDDYMTLAYNLNIEKSGNEISFKFKRVGSTLPAIILFTFALLVALISATYFGLLYLEYASLNKDIDGDGIADINLDLDDDNIADINIDTNGDNIPDLNIDYKGNKLAIFNIDTDEDGIADFNLVNDATEDIDTCTINCDINGDGWPNQNYDIDGDGIADFDIYYVDSGSIAEKIDLDGDMVCDVMCDDNEDGICDRNCITSNDSILGSGPSTSTGDSGNNVLSGSLLIQYKDSGEFNVSNLYPDDQYDDVDLPYNTFTVTNNSEFTLYYKITMIVDENTYTSDNFMYKIESTNNGYECDFTTAPWDDKIITSYVIIEPYETQNYTITFKLNGIDEEQNYDQGQTFSGYLEIGD